MPALSVTHAPLPLKPPQSLGGRWFQLLCKRTARNNNTPTQKSMDIRQGKENRETDLMSRIQFVDAFAFSRPKLVRNEKEKGFSSDRMYSQCLSITLSVEP